MDDAVAPFAVVLDGLEQSGLKRGVQNRAAKRYITQQATRRIEIVGLKVAGNQDNWHKRELSPKPRQRIEDFDHPAKTVDINEQEVIGSCCLGCLTRESSYL